MGMQIIWEHDAFLVCDHVGHRISGRSLTNAQLLQPVAGDRGTGFILSSHCRQCHLCRNRTESPEHAIAQTNTPPSFIECLY
ncbi:hypothetical protein CCM_03096 [Cordyceps militaris CM01]|uniref:Uncharacterized protein n=1 Tax=Cordyceps militaris (strain CM01) TaxID=983644 RepID=G3J8U2_CORMM|nr:uncharacterized protein CCM_03096 [Cordyceps militaris CM01]EGX94825.1 hypothetical protein CCM_03096 [Cordyceps militaris CM01]